MVQDIMNISPPAHPSRKVFYGLVIGAIGVVFGDIGTSPLYAVREAFSGEHGLVANPANILGILSLLIWSLLIVVTLKYIFLVMRADNRGEGGTFALLALAQRALNNKSIWITALGIFGASLFYGDGIITPAISVLSAVEGLEVATPALQKYILPITLIIVVMLFGFQQNGTDRIGKLFGPVTCLWFLTLGLLGIYQIVQYPDILNALNPYYGFEFFVSNHILGFVMLGTIVLAVTGVEALYADMGHFGRRPIRVAWLYFVMPCLLLNYLGQGALLIAHPDTISNPFYKMGPEWTLYPMVALATAATVVASQAMISGAYSITQQAIQLGFIPRFNIEHTSARHMGQIYIPRMNMMIFIGVVLLILIFKNSSALADAYGIAVTGTIFITTCLLFIVAHKLWEWPLWKTILIITPFWIVDLAFFSATLLKLGHGVGAWIPLLLGVVMWTVMMTWYQGRLLKNKRSAHGKERLDGFIKNLDSRKIRRIPGAAFYLSREVDFVPEALSIHAKFHKHLHEILILISVKTLDVPHVPEDDLIEMVTLTKGFVMIKITYGFMQQPNIMRALSALKLDEMNIDMREAPFFISRERVVATPGSGMWLWRERIYSFMHRNAAPVAEYFHLPASRVVEIGTPIKI
jgi:KUP system potassium uptake protein